MASKPSSVFDEEDRCLIRLRKMCDTVSRLALYSILIWLTPNWTPTKDSFQAYLKAKGNVSMRKFREALYPDQKKAMKKDQGGSSYDVSLLFVLIIWGNEFLAPKDDPAWDEGSGGLESLIRFVKNERNRIMHCFDPVDAKEFHRRTEKIRNLLIDMITKAGSVCKHIKQAEVDAIIQNLNDIINKTRDDPLDPMDFADYKRQPMFHCQCDFVNVEGKTDLNERHNKFTSISPASHLHNNTVPVDEVFIDMVLKKSFGMGFVSHVELKHLIVGDKTTAENPIILVEGIAGVGKTTLTKKMLKDWTSGVKEIEDLENYDLVFHAECRDQIKSFCQLLTISMAKVSRSFQVEDLKRVTLSLKCLVILDGLDELNNTSAELFRDLLTIKKHHDITFLITTRPEAVNMYYQQANSQQIKTRHIELLGIPQSMRDAFVTKYYNSLTKGHPGKQQIGDLLQYLKKTEHRLEYLWRLPYNLTLLTILWIYKPKEINGITTGPELYWQIYLLHFAKLLERLQRNTATKHLSRSILEKKIEHFLYSLCWESLEGLKNDDVNLPNEAYKRLENKCIELGVPAEEMVGAFLKKTTTSVDTRYSFPHKGMQEYLAALYVKMYASENYQSSDVQKVTQDVSDALLNSLPPSARDQIMNVLKQQLESMSLDVVTSTSTGNVRSGATQTPKNLRNIFERLHGTSSISLRKYQNLLTQVIGLFYTEGNSVKDQVKEEALELLQEAGVTDGESWIAVLNSVKCDTFTAEFINNKFAKDIFTSGTVISDSNIMAYISLTQQSLKLPHGINLKIHIVSDHLGLEDLSQNLLAHNIKVPSITLEESFKNPDHRLTFGNDFNQLLQKCQVTHYMGALTPDLHLPLTIDYLLVSVADEESYDHLGKFLSQPGIRLKSLGVCVGKDLDPTMVSVMPSVGRGLGYINLYIPDLKNHKGISDIIELFKPIINVWFWHIVFPRISIASGDLGKLLEEMRGGQVRVLNLVFPSSSRPSRKEEIDHLEETAKRTVNCRDIYWGELSIDEW